MNKIRIFKAIEIFLVFMLGFVSAYLVNYSNLLINVENPISSFGTSHQKAPSDFLNSSNILVEEDKIVIYIPNSSVSRYADTGSMLPVLNENTNGIKIIPNSEDEINVGDIVTFKKGEYLIVHRVVKKGTDNKGTYFVTKGDNNLLSDGKIRFEDILYKTVVLVY